ncbi:hypothetical protein V6N12_075444 [Hibiscus sabdariffa]|uniref:Uncharacterized protein n=1 Tax=Hibiscus sabdariffa TaxID=183260 RepID=A0ABR2C7M6_9ROSI
MNPLMEQFSSKVIDGAMNGFGWIIAVLLVHECGDRCGYLCRYESGSGTNMPFHLSPLAALSFSSLQGS